jgi:hypothetical protein
MASFSNCLSPAQQLELAVRVKSPAGLAQTFAAYAGQFPDRSDFDALARHTHQLYAAQDENQAHTFRTRLDRRLYDRYHEPVIWEIGPRRQSQAA